MATLTIGGKRVKVNDDFLSLSPEEQQRTVNEIATQIGVGAPAAPEAPAGGNLWEQEKPPEGAVPGSPAYAQWAAARARAGKKLPQVSERPPEHETQSLGAKFNAAYTSGVNAIPIVGPTLLDAVSNLKAGVQGVPREEIDRQTRILEETNPNSAMAGSIAGTVAPFVLASTVPVVSTILGVDVGAPLAVNIGAGALSQKAISHFDTLARGGDPNEVIPGINMKPEDLAAATGAAGPLVGKAVGAGLSALGEKVVDPTVRAVRGLFGDAEGAAQSVLGKTIGADLKAGAALSAADNAAAAAAGQPIINADRFGGATRELFGTSAKADPIAGQNLSELVQNRFLTQNDRAADWVTRNTGAPTNVNAIQQNLDRAAKGVNNAAYRTAYSQPAAQAVWTPEIEQLMQSQNFRDAIKAAIKTSGEEAALSGSKPIQNPFVFNQLNGSYTLRPGVKPSLEFWDHVQRALRRKAVQLGRSGEIDYDAGQVYRARAQLNDVLDTVVPEFATARGGAARWFGAEDALEAGQKAVGMKSADMPGARAAHAKFTPAEKRLAASGFASSLIGKINDTKDGVNVINKIFGSPQAREQIDLWLGKKASQELEPFLRVENAMQLTKQAIDAPAKVLPQLLGLGMRVGGIPLSIGYGTGAATGGMDPRNWGSKAWTMAMLGTAGKAGMSVVGRKVDQKVMQEVIRLLASDDPRLIAQAVKSATHNKRAFDALKAIEYGLSMVVRGAGAGAAGETVQ